MWVGFQKFVYELRVLIIRLYVALPRVLPAPLRLLAQNLRRERLHLSRIYRRGLRRISILITIDQRGCVPRAIHLQAAG